MDTIIKHVKQNGRITRQEAASITGMAIRTASRDIVKLVKIGLFVPDGHPGKTAGYILT